MATLPPGIGLSSRMTVSPEDTVSIGFGYTFSLPEEIELTNTNLHLHQQGEAFVMPFPFRRGFAVCSGLSCLPGFACIR